MPAGHRKVSTWVQVPKLKMKGMCALCGKNGKRWKTMDRRADVLVSYCSDNGKPCARVAMNCNGPFVMEHKVKKLIRECEME